MPSAVVWVQCHIRCVGPRCVRSDYNASRFIFGQWLVLWKWMAFYSADALAHCRSRPILAALPKRTSDSWSVARGYHNRVSLFHQCCYFQRCRPVCIISEMEISHYLVKFIASYKIRDQLVMHFSWICPVEPTLWQATEVLYLICWDFWHVHVQDAQEYRLLCLSRWYPPK